MDKDARSTLGWTTLRLTLAGLTAAHGWTRLLGGGVVPFSGWLDAQGLPAGVVIAAAITAVEVAGTILLPLRRLVLPLTLVYAGIYAVGIAMVHATEGRFVVGAGRNGA